MSENTYTAYSSDPSRALACVLDAEAALLGRWCSLYRADDQAFWSAASSEDIAEFCRMQNLDGVMRMKLAERLMSADAVLSETRDCSESSLKALRDRIGSLAEKLSVICRRIAPSSAADFS